VNAARRQSGASLTEVLVTLTITSFALLGLMATQARALSLQKDALDRRAGAVAVEQLAERMRGNLLGYLAGDYALTLPSDSPAPAAVPGCASATACATAEIAARDLAAWQIEMRRHLPSAALFVEVPGAAQPWAVITIAWQEPLTQGAAAAAEDLVCTATETRLAVTLPDGYRCYSSRVFP
jgi:type IV pilus assembly protein PilV